ncbi:hypothetical protein [Siphonobacter aquaeclarae]|uniref:Uncharacterized protein n=1 Tax=Siphonobacter aquaeclarae TaxID=563176 RepID=A0A1G9T1J2_9BACT|nr:hypothetical protein [Siphonobacter aquaeclarae]SDM41613.1 hypothetical protein SAMN04488090_3379 [Siphonobacter aquaeclarae]
MRQFKALAIVFASILAGILAFTTTQNVLAAALAVPATSLGLQYVTGVRFDTPGGLAYCTALTGLKRRCQQPSLGGSKRLFIVLTKDLEEEFITYDIIKTQGNWDAPIPLVTGKKFIEIEAWYDTTKWDGAMKPGAGFTQGVEFEVLGYDKDIAKLLTLLYETPVNVVVVGNDDTKYYLGQKYVPLMFESTQSSPVKGTDRKKTTFKASNDGFTVPIVPLGPLATFDVAPLPAAA